MTNTFVASQPKDAHHEGAAARSHHIIWKDEGRDDEGRSIGPAYTENHAGQLLTNYGWITWKMAQAIAHELRLELDEV